MRTREHYEKQPHRRRRRDGETAETLWPRHARRSVSRRCAEQWRREPGGGAVSRQHKNVVLSSAQRISAMMLRHWYLLRSSWPRLLDLVYWPTVQMVTWGFLQYYIASNAGFFARAGGTFIGAVLLWDILFRGQLGFSISFLEEMYSRNLGNIMMSPLRPFEFITAL